MAKPRLILRDLRHPRLPEGSYELNRSPIRIGRGPRCEIRLHSDRIADVQVILRTEADRWTLHPVGPAEGCEIHDGYLAESARLDHGTTFRIGHVEMMLSMGHESETSPVEARPEEIAETPFGPEGTETAHAPLVPEEVKPLVPQPVPIAATELVAEKPDIATLTHGGESSRAHHDTVEIPPQPAADSPRSAFAGSVLFPDSAPSAPISHVSKRPGNLRIGPLPSSAAAAVSKALGSLVGAETTADLAVPRAAVRPKTGGNFSAGIDQSDATSAFGREIPRLPARKTGTADRVFEPPIVPAGSRTLPLRRFLRDHDSSNLRDGRSMTMSVADSAGAPLVFGQIPIAPVAPIEAPAIPVPPPQVESRDEVESAAHAPHSPWFSRGVEEMPTADSEPAANDSWLEAAPATATPPEEAADLATEAAQNLMSIESTVAEFETWLRSVGPNLESVDDALSEDDGENAGDHEPPDAIAANGSLAASDHEPAPDWADATAEEPNQADIGVAEAIGELSAGPEPAFAPRHDAEPGIAVEPTLATIATKTFERQAAEGRVDSTPRTGFDPKSETPSRADSQEWPSAQDILRWSADRHGRSFLLATSEDLKSMKMAPDRTRPREWFRMNFPTALLLCLAWLGGAGFLVSIGLRMSLQDELTQQSIASVLASEKSGAVPRLDPASMQRLTESASWWEVPPVQRWFRAVFVKMREDKGQPLQVSADQMASEVASLDPLYPPARFWKNTSPSADVGEPDLSSLSLDLLPLIMQADFERRRGNHEKANEADRIALKMASDLDKPLQDQDIAFDAEFGTKRFLLPGQKRTLAILKRIANEPDAATVFDSVMPPESPIVWLTAAQLMRHAGFGDAEALAAKAAQFPIPDNASTDRRIVLELARAEANAMLGKNDLAIETYDRLVKELPDSEWKRTVYLNLGMLNLQSLKTEAAKLALKKARGEDPDHEIDRHAIATIRGLSDIRPDGTRSATTVRAN